MRTCKENNCAGFGAFDARYDQGDVQGGMRKRYRDSFREELLLLIVKGPCWWLRSCLALNRWRHYDDAGAFGVPTVHSMKIHTYLDVNESANKTIFEASSSAHALSVIISRAGYLHRSCPQILLEKYLLEAFTWYFNALASMVGLEKLSIRWPGVLDFDSKCHSFSRVFMSCTMPFSLCCIGIQPFLQLSSFNLEEDSLPVRASLHF